MKKIFIMIAPVMALAACEPGQMATPSAPVAPKIVPAGSAGFPASPEIGTLYFGPDGCQYSYLQMGDRFAWVPRFDGARKPVCQTGVRVS